MIQRRLGGDSRTVKSESDQLEQILNLIDQIKGMLSKLKSKKDQKAMKKIWKEAGAKIYPIFFENIPNSQKENLYDKIQDLAKSFIDILDNEMARLTLLWNFSLIIYLNPAERIEKLDNLGSFMRKIAEQEKRRGFKADYEFMDRILDEMHARFVMKIWK